MAELAHRPDVPTSVRKLPAPTPTSPSGTEATPPPPAVCTPSAAFPAVPAPASLLPPPRPIVQASAPARYRVQFTIGEETHEKLRRLQNLLRREIPDGDPGAIFDQALTLLLDKVERTKLGQAAKLRPRPAIRPRTDSAAGGPTPRHIPREVRRAVWRRDGGRCGFVSATGARCTERTFLEFHHIQPYAREGPATVDNITLHCRRHNQYEAELVFGPHGPSTVREVRPVRAL